MALTADTLIDSDTKLSDVLPVELFSLFQKSDSLVKKYEATTQDKIDFLVDLIEAYDVIGDIEMASLKRQELKILIA